MQKVTKRNIALAIIFLLILVVVALLIGNFTFSYLGADIGEDVNNQGETTASGDTIIFSKGNDLSLHATTDNFNATSGNLTATSNPSARLIASSKTNSATATYYVGIRIYSNTYTYSSGTTADVILTVRDETGAILTASDDNALSYVTVTDASGTSISGFDITGKTGVFNISREHSISTTSSTSGTTQTWTFTLTFVNYTYDQSINENATLDMEVILQRDEITSASLADVCSNGDNLANCIQSYYATYGEGYGGLYYHDGVGSYTNANLEAGDNSYRYSGANPNNFVCFGSDYPTCAEDNIYRIIGVFNGQVKLIKYDYASEEVLGTASSGTVGIESFYKGNLETISGYYWNGGASNNTNTWSNSLLNNDILNGTYLNNLGSDWSNKISNYNWQNQGMIYSTGNNVKKFYDAEFNNGIVNTYKVSLMYVSDYGYAASPENWSSPLYSADNDTNRNNNWIYMGGSEWILSPQSSTTDNAFYLYAGGSMLYAPVTYLYGIRPVFYLNSDVTLVGGNGTLRNPYRIS